MAVMMTKVVFDEQWPFGDHSLAIWYPHEYVG